MYLCFEATVILKFSREIKAREITSEKYMLGPQVRLQLQSKESNERAHRSHSQSSESGPSGHCIPVGQAWTGMNCSEKKYYLRNLSAYHSQINEDLTYRLIYHLVFT